MMTTADHTYASTPEDREVVERDQVEEDTTEKVCFSQYNTYIPCQLHHILHV